MTVPLVASSPHNIDTLSLISQQLAEQKDTALLRTYKKGGFIFQSNQHADKVYILKSGRIKIGTQNAEGKEIIKRIIAPGELFGELSMLGQAVRKDYAVAMEACEVYVMATEDLSFLLQNNRTLSVYFLQTLGRQLIEFERRLESLVFDNSRNRIIRFLDGLVEKRGQRVGYEMLVRKMLTHQEIANLTATSRQTVTMVLNELRSKNILTFNRRRLLIRDMDLLRAEAA